MVTCVPRWLSQSIRFSSRIRGSFFFVSIWTSKYRAGAFGPMREVIWTDLPVVICPYMPAAEIPIPCCPRLMRNRWNLDPYRSFAKIFGICWRTMPGPLSVTVIRKRLAWVGGGGVSPLATTSTLTTTSGRIPASSQASSALSTPSLTQVSSAFRGLSNPRRCRFLVKNSETEISRCRAPNSTAVTAGFGGGAGGLVFAGGLVSAAGLPFEGLSFRPCFAEGAFFDGFRIWRAPISTAVTADFGCGAGGLVFVGGVVFEGFSFRPRFAEGIVVDGFRIWASFGCKDLATYAVCIGRTGRGKTGLCLAFLERAAGVG